MLLRTEAGSEVDFILELQNKLVAIELKASLNIRVASDRPDCYLANITLAKSAASNWPLSRFLSDCRPAPGREC